MFREGDPEVTLAHWAIIRDYADAVLAQVLAEIWKCIDSLVVTPCPHLICESCDPQRKPGDDVVPAFHLQEFAFDGIFQKDVEKKGREAVNDVIFMCGECGWPYKQAGAREVGAVAPEEKCEKCGGGLFGSKESPVIWIQYFCLQRVDVQEIDSHGGPFGEDALKRGWHA